MGKILAVDDNEKITHVMTRMLENDGHEVITANSGVECLEILKTVKPDLILMDVMMPNMDGWEVVREIKKDKSNKDIKISMLTIRNTENDMIKSMDGDLGADWHLAKPISQKRLLEAVEWLLGQE
jgi:two-component system alkaline phosphatase synthesis response regulator PhoP